jgi:hypothetical protein
MGEAKRRAAALPSLKEYLVEHTQSHDAGERDNFDAYFDWTFRILAQKSPDEAEHAQYLRLLKIASLAIVEGYNHEIILGFSAHDAMIAQVRTLGVAFGYALMSAEWKDDTPFRTIARAFGEQFVDGIKFAIDSCLERETRT